MIKQLKVFCFFISILMVFSFNLYPVFADENNSENDLTISTESQEEINANEKLYRKIIESYGYSCNIEVQIVSNPIKRKNEMDWNSLYYINFKCTEVTKSSEFGYSGIDFLSYVLDTAGRDYTIETNGDLRTFIFSSNTSSLKDVNFLLASTGYFVYPNTQYNNIISCGYGNNVSSLTSLEKYVRSNAKLSIILKTKNDILTYNIENTYQTNENGFKVYKFEINPTDEDYLFAIFDISKAEIIKTNDALQFYILIFFNLAFLGYLYYENKKGGEIF